MQFLRVDATARIPPLSGGGGGGYLLRSHLVLMTHPNHPFLTLVAPPPGATFVSPAADLAAFFSDARRADEVKVMYTDSRHVAKRGGRVGQLKDGKKIGLLTAHTESAALLAREAQDEQGWPV